ncbi:MAG: hypothetical protein HY550_10545 [Elusimicrobia bacterium]|nr:hypothetical protein [Elusimicrobiota bacterium]
MEPATDPAGNTHLRKCGKALTASFLACLCLLPASRSARGQNMPLDDKARYERSLELKVEEVLLRLLGPNQAKVVVQASMDFTRTEKVDMTSQAAAGAAKDSMFKWDGTATEGQGFSEYLLPGFPSMGSAASKPETTTYEKQMLYPVSFVKKLVVTVILNKNLQDSEAQAVRSVVSDILSMDQKRGDELVIIKTPFAPFWRTIWYTPEAMSLVFKYGILTIMGIIAMIVVAIGFLKLAQAMNTMAKAQQGHQITMDLGKSMSGLPGLPGAGAAVALGPLPGEKKEAGGEAGGDNGGKVVFNVRPDQVVFLVNLMAGEDPANVALVAVHLPPEVRSEFLRLLAPEAASDVISHMAKVRFVEPEIIATIKDELERRLSGSLGGVEQVLEVLEKVDLRAKKELLEELSKKDPATARLVRGRVFLPEDLARLPEKDLSLVVSSFRIEAMAAALWEFPQPLRDAIKKQMADKAWQMVEQTMKYGAPSRESSGKAAEELVESALKLVKEGRIPDPLESGAALPDVQGKTAAGLPAPGGAEPARG